MPLKGHVFSYGCCAGTRANTHTHKHTHAQHTCPTCISRTRSIVSRYLHTIEFTCALLSSSISRTPSFTLTFIVLRFQAVGKVPLDVNDMNIDLMSISGHKVYVSPPCLRTCLLSFDACIISIHSSPRTCHGSSHCDSVAVLSTLSAPETPCLYCGPHFSRHEFTRV